MSGDGTPPPGATPAEVAKYLARLVNDGKTSQAQQYVDSHLGGWTAGQLVDFSVAAADVGEVGLVDLHSLFAEGTDLGDRYWRLFEDGDLEDTAYQAIKGGAALDNPSPDLDRSGNTDPSEQAAWDAAVARHGREIAGNDKIGDEAAGQLGEADIAGRNVGSESFKAPEIVMAYMGRTRVLGGDPEFDRRVSEMIRTWNEFNPDRKVRTRDELFGFLQNANDPDVTQVMDSVFLGRDPIRNYEIRMRDGRTVQITAEEFDAFTKTYGTDSGSDSISRVGLANLVRAADRAGLKNVGVPLWQIAPALVRAGGVKTVDVNEMASPLEGDDRRFGLRNSKVKKAQVTNKTVNNSLQKYKEGLYIYQSNDALAFLHAVNPTLAARAAMPQDGLDQTARNHIVKQVNNTLNRAGFTPQQLDKMGYYSLGLEDWANSQASSGGGGGGGGGSYRIMPDPLALRQAAKDLYISLFAGDPSEADLDRLVAAVNGAVTSTPMSQNVDVNAQLRNAIENDPMYKELYGSMPGGMAESDYQGQFRHAASSMLGAEAADPTAIQSGMRTGDYQTTVGQVAGSKQAWGNSTFLGRLAQAAQVIAENT